MPFIFRSDATVEIDAFTESYIECALWSSTDQSNEQGGDPLDDNYGPEDIAPKTLDKIVKECAAFQENWRPVYLPAGWTDDQAGHDFWLTRNHHGAGFWDRGRGEVGKRLTDACRPYGSVYLYVGDDGKIHI